MKGLASTSVKIAKSAATFWKTLSGIKNPQICCLVVMVHFALWKRRVATTRNENYLPFDGICPPITFKHTWTWAKKGKNHSICGLVVSTTPWLKRSTKKFLYSQFIHFQSTVKQHVFLSLQRRFWVVSRFWTTFIGFDCKRSDPWNDDKIPKDSSRSLELAVVSKTRVFKQPSISSSSYTNQQGTHEIREEVLSNVGAQDIDTSGYQVPDLDDVEFYCSNAQLDVTLSLDRTLILLFHQQRLTTWRREVERKTPSPRGCREQRELSSTKRDPMHCWEFVHLEQEI